MTFLDKVQIYQLYVNIIKTPELLAIRIF